MNKRETALNLMRVAGYHNDSTESVQWRTEKKCDNCPFRESGAGLALRKSLLPGRWRSILAGLLRGEHFYCHKTAEYSDDDEETLVGKQLVCAGSIEWQDAHGCSSQYVRIYERLFPRTSL